MIEHAKKELKKNGLEEHKIGKSVLELIETFYNQKNSKEDIEKIKIFFNQILDSQNLNQVDGDKNEWIEISKNIYQNKKLKTLFKQYDKAYFINAIVWKTKNQQEVFAGNAKTKDGRIISSRQMIKIFPFIPKTFQIEVEEILGDLFITQEGEKKLIEVFNYYKLED